jgi:hypothetical protein
VRKLFIALALCALCPLLLAQQAQTLTNDSLIKLIKAGFQEDVIVKTIESSGANYDTSVDGLIALKNAGATNKMVAAILSRASSPTPLPVAPPPAASEAAPPPGGQSFTVGTATPSSSANKPRVFLQSKSSGNQWAAVRDQAMEMSKDFEQVCPDVRISLNQQMADYTVALNHIEHGFARDNQIQVANKDGDLISKTKEGGSIKGGVKKACDLILADWAKK